MENSCFGEREVRLREKGWRGMDLSGPLRLRLGSEEEKVYLVDECVGCVEWFRVAG